MQDAYIGDIGDFGKYGLLREICNHKLTLSVNWYKVNPQGISKQEDGKYTSYLLQPNKYREYDSELFDKLHRLIIQEKDRRTERIENAGLFRSEYFSEEIETNRSSWHTAALEQTKHSEVVFLDPDNGLETPRMSETNKATEKHVKWSELKDYYSRGQNVILYQHRPQMMKKEDCIKNIIIFQNAYLQADYVKMLEFPKFTNRYYFIFLHKEYKPVFDSICISMAQKWSKNKFCFETKLD